MVVLTPGDQMSDVHSGESSVFKQLKAHEIRYR